jgi:dipeptidyl aminopeptidase/acylaminoacyl peptidase
VRYRIWWRVIAGLMVFAHIGMAAPVSHAGEAQGFSIEHYFQLRRIDELALSQDGQWLAYVTSRRSLEENRTIRKLYVQRTMPGGEALLVEGVPDAQQIAWIPRSQKLAFLAERNGSTQVVSYDARTGELKTHTNANEPIVEFGFAPDGETVAYATMARSTGESLYEQLWNGRRGVVVDTDTLYLFDFVAPHGSIGFTRPNRTLWVAFRADEARRFDLPGSMEGWGRLFWWSPDGRYLSVSYERADLPRNGKLYAQTSIGVLEPATGRLREVAAARGASVGAPAIKYFGGQWLDAKRLVVGREIDEHIWVSPSYPEWTVLEISRGGVEERTQWWPGAENGWFNARIWPLDRTSILVETLNRAEKTLLRLSAGETQKSPLLEGVDGSSSLFTFSAGGELAYVNQSLTRPPEVYFRDKQGRTRPVTRLNAEIQSRVRFSAREVTWHSLDGAPVSGWLMLPGNQDKGGPYPLVTYVHGGPAAAFPNAFASYVNGWPFPFEVLADRGIAVFFPNYRGTASFGRRHELPSSIDVEPVEDVISGVRYLVDQGIADPDRLGISGHSHGAWLGPLVVAKHKRVFRAASFAEGWGNEILGYELMPSRGNRELNEVVIEADRSVNLYDDPLRFLELSPSLQFRGVATALLLEAGIESQALLMMPFAKAARRFDIPHEFVIYPRTSHGIDIPDLQRESAERNLEWFEFWLLGKHSDDPERAEQFSRWMSSRKRAEEVSTQPVTAAKSAGTRRSERR